jgi:hypothetical protein
MFEFMVRLKWLLLDLEVNLILWKLNDINYRLTLDREVREWADANQRQMEILQPAFRDELKRLRDDLTGQLADIGEARGLERVHNYPSLKAQAEEVGQTVEYSLAYRLDSQSAAHPSVLAIQNLARQLPDGTIEIFAATPQPGPGSSYAQAATSARRSSGHDLQGFHGLQVARAGEGGQARRGQRRLHDVHFGVLLQEPEEPAGRHPLVAAWALLRHQQRQIKGIAEAELREVMGCSKSRAYVAALNCPLEDAVCMAP